MPLTFADHLALLEQHGRAATESIAAVSPDAAVPPRGSSCQERAEDFWGTAEIWAWSLEHPDRTWRERDEPPAPEGHSALVSDLAHQLARAVASLRASGPDVTVDYFDRPGTTADVARLLAHEAIATAYAVGIATGRPAPMLSAETACDGIDHLLDHWADPSPEIRWRPQAMAIRSLDAGAEWFIDAPASSDDIGAFRRAAPIETPAAIVEGASVPLLWWLHGHPLAVDVNAAASPVAGRLRITGDAADIRALHHAFALAVPKSARRRWRWFG